MKKKLVCLLYTIYHVQLLKQIGYINCKYMDYICFVSISKYFNYQQIKDLYTNLTNSCSGPTKATICMTASDFCFHFRSLFFIYCFQYSYTKYESSINDFHMHLAYCEIIFILMDIKLIASD